VTLGKWFPEVPTTGSAFIIKEKAVQEEVRGVMHRVSQILFG
jgi:hypothetical protein